jgi:hypothetical protein
MAPPELKAADWNRKSVTTHSTNSGGEANQFLEGRASIIIYASSGPRGNTKKRSYAKLA